MRKPSSTEKKPETALQKEFSEFKRQVKRLINCWINNIFDLSAKGSRRRGNTLTVLFLAAGIFFILRNNPIFEWVAQLSSFFQFMLRPGYASQSTTVLNDFIQFVKEAVFGLEALRYLPVFILPYLIGLQAASLYLDDIFELKRVNIAREFIQQVALTGSRKKIRFAQGELVKADRESPIFLIGGPGKVVVELDTAVLFEKPDGRPHVIGPNTKNKTLDGFERFRGFKNDQAIDLRDQYIDPISVSSRSLDGIPVSAADVRMVFSVHRNENPTPKTPHPFDEKAIEILIYDQASRVQADGNNPSEPPTSWTGTMQGLIRGSLSAFMNKNRLAEYLASIGPIETDAAEKREEDILNAKKLVVSESDSSEKPPTITPPTFRARHTVSALFKKFADDFAKSNFTITANQRGVDLHWVGVGTWKTPEEIMSKRHLDAWKLSRENAARGNIAAMNAFKQESELKQTLRYIQNVPLERYRHGAKMEKHKDAIQYMLLGYREQLIEAVEFLNKSGKPVHDEILKAITHIEIVIGAGQHWVGRAGKRYGKGAPVPPSGLGPSGSGTGRTTGIPSTRPVPKEEEDSFRYLVKLCSGDDKQARKLIEFEQKKRPHADRKDLIERAIEHLIRDRN